MDIDMASGASGARTCDERVVYISGITLFVLFAFENLAHVESAAVGPFPGSDGGVSLRSKVGQ